MIFKSRNLEALKVTFVLFPLFSACAPAPRLFLQYGSDFKQAELDKILAENPLPPGENIKVTTLGQGPTVSHHVVQIRDREIPHVHKLHDATITMLKGGGYLILEKQRIDLVAGDVVYIPRAAVHYFVNTHSELAVAFAAFSPPFDGKDTHPAEKP
jgi:mannose-6-phosphate isomerase-like protein (cupin superfamily)